MCTLTLRDERLRGLLLAASLALVLQSGAQTALASEPDPAAVFAEGERIIAENDTEKVGATEAGMLRGAIRIEEALSLGYPDRFKAYRLLGYAYSQIRLGLGSDAITRGGYLERARHAYGEAAKLRPDDADVLMELARIQPVGPGRAEALRAVLRVDPRHASALYLLGRDLVEGIGGNADFTRQERAAQIEEGVVLLKRAAAAQRGPEARERRSEISAILDGAGRKADAAEVRRKYGLRAR